jgi:hypothetical protein
MNYFQRRKILNNINTMDLIPVRTQKYEKKEGKIIILIPKFKSRFYHAIAPSTARLFFRIKLDDLGSTTWEAIDGKRNIQELGNFIREGSHEGEPDLPDLDERLSKYMMMLYERRFISFKQIINY